MQTTDTQAVGGQEGARLASGFLNTLTQPAEGRTAPQQENAPAAPAPAPVEPAAAAPAPATPTPATPAAPATPETPDPYAAAVTSMFAQAPTPTWDDAAKAAFKATFGDEDPAAYKQRMAAELEQGSLWKTKYDEVAPLRDSIANLPPTTQKVIQLALSGKVKEAQDYLKTAPTMLLEGKPSKSIDKVELTKAYYGDKLTAEQWAMLKDPEADQDIVDALNTRIDILHASAVDKHEAALNAAATERQTEEAAKQEYTQRYHASVADTVSTAKNSPLSAFLDQGTIGEMTTGEFLNKYVNPDGTPTKAAATLHLYALHGEKLVKAAEESGYKRGRSEALQEATSRMPAGIAGNGRAAAVPVTDASKIDPARALMYAAIKDK